MDAIARDLASKVKREIFKWEHEDLLVLDHLSLELKKVLELALIPQVLREVWGVRPQWQVLLIELLSKRLFSALLKVYMTLIESWDLLTRPKTIGGTLGTFWGATLGALASKAARAFCLFLSLFDTWTENRSGSTSFLTTGLITMRFSLFQHLQLQLKEKPPGGFDSLTSLLGSSNGSSFLGEASPLGTSGILKTWLKSALGIRLKGKSDFASWGMKGFTTWGWGKEGTCKGPLSLEAIQVLDTPLWLTKSKSWVWLELGLHSEIW